MRDKLRFSMGTVILTLALAGLAGLPPATAESPDKIDLTSLSLEELMKVEVNSVAKKPQNLSETTAAVAVLTREDLRRSGATSIPEALRLVPGLQVARIDANKWAVTARGFNNRFANKMLVLIDGRSVYTPLFAGVYWDVQDVALEEIERIEVIRGPGATLWGANAVNGVINIVTRHAAEAEGGLVSMTTGGEEQAVGSLHWGDSWDERTHYRVYARYTDRDHQGSMAGLRAADQWSAKRVGFRLDRELDDQDTLAVLAEVYDGSAGQTTTTPTLDAPYSETERSTIDFSGGNAVARWTHVASERSELTLLGYFDSTKRREPRHGEQRQTFDIDFQHRLNLSQGQELMWGLGYRHTDDRIRNSFAISFDPVASDQSLFSAFVQHDYTASDGDFRLTSGTKLEHNDYTGFEFQPNLRALWKIGETHAVWTAASHAVRSPARAFTAVRFSLAAFPDESSGMTALVVILGNPDFRSEELDAIEAGYRVCPTARWCLDTAAFHNWYRNLTTLEPGTPSPEADPAPMHLLVPQIFENRMSGVSRGIEISSTVNLMRNWRLIGWYGFLDLELEPDAASADNLASDAAGDNPRHQYHLRSQHDLPRDLKLDLALYHVDDLPSQGVPDYTRVDVRLAWSPDPRLELSLAAQNLLDSHHPEFGSFLVNATEVQRSVFGRIAWRF